MPKPKNSPSFELLTCLYQQGYQSIVGIDEVGRGALGGPLVVGAVELKVEIPSIDDSKRLSAIQRQKLATAISVKAVQRSIGIVSPEEIDTLGLSAAQRLAYERCLARIHCSVVLTDNYQLPNHLHLKAIKGDQLFYPVAAASIVAKVYRDQLMHTYHQFFPMYGWDKNTGYGTSAHFEAIKNGGTCVLHRRTFLGNL